MKTLVIAVLVLLIPFSSPAGELEWLNDGADGWTAGDDWDADNIDAVKANLDLKDSVVFTTDPNTPGTTTSGIQEAIDACADGTGSPNAERCIVQLPCTDADGLTVDGLTLSDLEGVVFQGCGSGTTSNAATYIKWAGTSGGTVLTIDNVRQFDISNVHIDCDGASNDAGIGIQLLRTGAIVTQFGQFSNVTVSNCTDVAIKNGPTGANSQQIDSIKFDLVRMRNSARCYYQSSSQSVHIRFDTGECTGATSSPGFDIIAGEFIFENGFAKTPEASSSMVLFDIDELALTHIENNRFEIYGTTPTVISSTDGEGTRDTNTIRGNFFNIQTPGATCITWNRRGHLWVESNGFGGFNDGANEGCVLSAQSTVGSAGNKFLDVHSYGNSHRGVWVAADFGGSLDYSRLPWVAGADTTIYEDGRIGGAAIATSSTSVAAGDVTGTIGGGLTIGAGVVEASMVAADVATQAELDAKSAASNASDGGIPRFDGTSGDLQDSGCTINDSDVLSCGTGPSFEMHRDTDDAGWTECGWLNGVETCAIDADGVIDGTL